MSDNIRKYLDIEGLSHFWTKNKEYVLNEISKINQLIAVEAPVYVDTVDEMIDTSKLYVLRSTGHIFAYMNKTTEKTENIVTFINKENEDSSNPFIADSRLSSSATSFTDGFSNDATGYNITPLIDLTKEEYQGKTIEITLSGCKYATKAITTWIQHRAYGSDGSVRYARDATCEGSNSSISLWNNTTLQVSDDETSAILTISIPLLYGSSQFDIGYLRFCGEGDIEDAQISISYPITQVITGYQWVDTNNTYNPNLTEDDKQKIINEIINIIDSQMLDVIGDGAVTE